MKRTILRGLLLALLLSTSIFVLFSCGDKESPKYELEFFVDGESYSTLSIESNATVEMPTDPSKVGYEFDGWYYDKNIWSKKYNGEAIIDDTKIYAKFDVIEYDITYQTDGGTHNNKNVFTVEDSFSLSAAKKDGFEFLGWYNGENKIESIEKGTVGNITLIARWEPIFLGKINYNKNKTAICENDSISAELFSATALNSDGESIVVNASIVNGSLTAGQKATIRLSATDLNGAVETVDIECEVYGIPTVLQSGATNIKTTDSISAETLGIAAKDSFDNTLNVTVKISSGSKKAGTTITVTAEAKDKCGNVATQTFDYKVYGTPTLSSAAKTDVTVSDSISVSLLGITATDSFGQPIDASLSVKSGAQTAGTEMVVTVTTTDILGNSTFKDYKLKVFGLPTITYEGAVLKSNVVNNKESIINALNISAKNSFGQELDVQIGLKSGTGAPGTISIYTITASDHLGNTQSVDTSEIKIYDSSDINLVYDSSKSTIIKFASKGEEFEATATDSFGELCVITLVAADGFTIKGGETVSLYIVATDAAGNSVKSQKIEGIKVYDIPTLTFDKDSDYILITDNLQNLFSAQDSFGQALDVAINYEGVFAVQNIIEVTAKIQDVAGNEYEKHYSLPVLSDEYPMYASLYLDGQAYSSHYLKTDSTLPTIEDVRNFLGWVDENGVFYTDEIGNLVRTYEGNKALYAKFEYEYIKTKDDLKNISLNGKYILFNDIDYEGEVWTPIGTASDPFVGVFDGQGHTIKNYSISASKNYIGLFGANAGTIKNLNVAEVVVNSQTSGNIYAGMLVGHNSGIVQYCSSTGDLTAKSGSSTTYAGGLVGYNTGVVVNSYSKGSVTTSFSGTSYAGGLLGYCDGGAAVNSYASVEVNATATNYAYAGGFAGYVSKGLISSSFASGNVTSSYYGGGFIGGGWSSDRMMVNCYSAEEQKIESTKDKVTVETVTAISNLSNKEWLESNIWTNDTIDFWSFENSHPTLNHNNIINNIKTIDIASTEDLQKLQNGVLLHNYRLTADISLNGTSWNPIVFMLGNFKGNGYTISSFSIESSSAYIGFIAYNAGDIESLNISGCTISVSGSYISPYSGLLAGYNLSGYIYDCSVSGRYSGTRAGTFGGLVGYNNGEISNCDSNLTYAPSSYSSSSSTNYVGGLVGTNYGSIYNCSSAGSIQCSYGSVYTGGLVSQNYGTISYSNSSCTTTITSGKSAYSGGLVAYNKGDISDSYATGRVSANCSDNSGSTACLGGLVGNNAGKITNCYATGSATATATGGWNPPYKSYAYAYAGGLVGENSGSIKNSTASGNANATASSEGSNVCAYAYAGGFMGYCSGTWSDCSASGTATASGKTLYYYNSKAYYLDGSYAGVFVGKRESN